MRRYMARSKGQADPRQYICEGVVNHCAKLGRVAHGCKTWLFGADATHEKERVRLHEIRPMNRWERLRSKSLEL